MDYLVKAYKDWKFHSQFHEIVPDMDDEYMWSEKQSIRESARSLKKYGSTCCNHIRNNETLIRHDVGATDTLQGIALRYGCTTEQIRRANRLFASDSLFLRQFLLIPVDKSSPFYPQPLDAGGIDLLMMATADVAAVDAMTAAAMTRTAAQAFAVTTPASALGNAAASPLTTTAATTNNPRPSVLPPRPYSIAGELLLSTHDDDDDLLNNHGDGGSNSGGSKQSKSLDSVVTLTPDEENRRCISEFLSKIDSTILESRKYVEKSRDRTLTSQSDDDLFSAPEAVQRRRNNNNNNINNNNNNINNGNGKSSNQSSHSSASSSSTNHMRHSSTGSGSDTAHLLSTTQTRRVQNSLKRLESKQDEFFEL